jgi:hypothetical protein
MATTYDNSLAAARHQSSLPSFASRLFARFVEGRRSEAERYVERYVANQDLTMHGRLFAPNTQALQPRRGR